MPLTGTNERFIVYLVLFLFVAVRNYASTHFLFEEKMEFARSGQCVFESLLLEIRRKPIKLFSAHKAILSPYTKLLIHRESGASINHKHTVMARLHSTYWNTLTQQVGNVTQSDLFKFFASFTSGTLCCSEFITFDQANYVSEPLNVSVDQVLPHIFFTFPVILYRIRCR